MELVIEILDLFLVPFIDELLALFQDFFLFFNAEMTITSDILWLLAF